MIDNRLTVATAESCTVGMIAAAIGDIPGVSDIFCEGFVTYSNAAKEKNLGVPGKILKSFGAVSVETARAMAEGVCNKTNANIGISATGIAGPGGGTKEQTCGTGLHWRLRRRRNQRKKMPAERKQGSRPFHDGAERL